MLLEQFLGVCGHNLSNRRSGSNDAAQTIHGSPLEINTAKQRSLHCRLTDSQQLCALMRRLYVAREKNNSAWMHAGEEACCSRRSLGAFQAHDDQLPNTMTQGKRGSSHVMNRV